MPATTYFENLVLDHALRQQPFSVANWYVGLWTANPTAAGLLTGEVTAVDYQRQPVVWDTAFGNTSLVGWSAALNDWGDITYVCVLNSPTKATGNMLGFQIEDPSLDANPGVTIEIQAGALNWNVI